MVGSDPARRGKVLPRASIVIRSALVGGESPGDRRLTCGFDQRPRGEISPTSQRAKHRVPLRMQAAHDANDRGTIEEIWRVLRGERRGWVRLRNLADGKSEELGAYLYVGPSRDDDSPRMFTRVSSAEAEDMAGAGAEYAA